MKAKTPAFKARRRALKNLRFQLRNKWDQLKGETYNSHVGLLRMPALEPHYDSSDGQLPSLNNNFDYNNNLSTTLVFFRSGNCENEIELRCTDFYEMREERVQQIHNTDRKYIFRYIQSQ